MTRRTVRRILLFLIIVGGVIAGINAHKIWKYSQLSTPMHATVAIILGHGTSNCLLSPTFIERVDHGVKLYKLQHVKKLIITGGYGKNQTLSDSKCAKEFAISRGVVSADIFIEEKSKYTIQNLSEAKLIMDSLAFEDALLVSHPLHMKRSIALAEKQKIKCYPSPVVSPVYHYQWQYPMSLLYETFFYTCGQMVGANK